MISNSKRFYALLIGGFAVISMIVLSCNLSGEPGQVYLQMKSDSSWLRFDTVEISWKDPATAVERVLFRGDPESLDSVTNFPADEYRGQPIELRIRGMVGGSIAFEEVRAFDSREPERIDRDTLIGKPGKPDTVGKPDSKAPSIEWVVKDSLLSIRDSLAFTARITMDIGSLASYAWDYDGDGDTDDSLPITGALATIRGGFRFIKAGTYKPALKAFSDAGKASRSESLVRVHQDTPVARAGQDTIVFAGTLVQLHGSAEDTLGRIVSTEWKIGSDASGAASPETTFTAPDSAGSISCIFSAVDDDGQAATDEVRVHVISRAESNLAGLSVSAGSITGRFNPAVLGYIDTVDFSVSGITVTPSAAGEIKVDGNAVSSGRPSDSIPLALGRNEIKVSVQAQDAAAKVYALVIFRREASPDADLAALTLSAGPLDRVFASADTAYAVTAADSVATTTVTASASSATASVAINGFSVASGAASGGINLATGQNAIRVTVTAQSGRRKTYSIVVTRQANADARLSSLSISAGTLVPPFKPEVFSYSMVVGHEVVAATATPAAAASSSKIEVDGKTVASGTASAALPLGVGENRIPIVVTAQDGGSQTYVISLVRAAQEALSALSLSAGSLNPTFHPDSLSYSVVLANGITSLAVTPATSTPGPVITVNGMEIASGSQSPASALSVGVNTVQISVINETGDKRIYRLLATRLGNANANLSNLVLSAGDFRPVFHPDSLDYSITVGYGTASATLRPTAESPQAAVAVNDASVASGSLSGSLPLAAGDNTLTVTVTAESGAKKEYRVKVHRNARVIAIAAGEEHSLLLRQDGTLVGFGRVVVPDSLINLAGIRAIASGNFHNLALRSDSSLQIWGFWSYAQDPVAVPAGLKNVVSMAGGLGHSVALLSDSTVTAWGRTVSPQSTVPAGLTGVKAVGAGGTYTVALKGDGSVVAWGTGPAATVPTGLTEVVSISAGNAHVLALKRDGTVVAWGESSWNRLNAPAGLAGVKAVAAGTSHSVALKQDGTVVAWGYGTQGQTNVPSGLDSVIAIAAGFEHTMALKENGAVVIWGTNAKNQSAVPPGVY